MAKTDALARVTADLAQGHTQPAIQRLSSLVAVHPTDLDLRHRLAAVHRMVGNRIEAGRWAYLDPGSDPGDVAAFEAAYPSPAGRLAALRWPTRAGLAATGYARGRLDALSALAAAETAPAGRRAPLGAALLVGMMAVTAVFAVIGAVTLAQWLM